MGAAGSKLEKALGDQFPEGERYLGLENFGNTCYCNSVLQAPLLLGCDIRNMTKEIVDIITNKEVIAVNQDSLGIQAKKVRMEGDIEIWAGPLSGYRVVVILLNRGPWRISITANWDDIDIPPQSVVEARDLGSTRHWRESLWIN